MRLFWKWHIDSKTLVKARLKFHSFFWGGGGGLGADFHFWVHWPKIQKKKKNDHKLRSYGLLGVLNTLLAFSIPGERYFEKKPYIA